MGSALPRRAAAFAKKGLVFSCFSGVIFFVLCSYAGPAVGLFTEDEAVVAKVTQGLSIVRWALLLNGPVQVMFTLFEAIGTTGKSSLVFVVGDIVGASCAVLQDSDGFTAATWGLTVAMGTRFALLSILAPSRLFRRLRTLAASDQE